MFLLEVYPCKNSTFKNDCAPQTFIDEVHKNFSNFYFSINLINNIMNPNKPEPISNFITTKATAFSKLASSEITMTVSDFTVNTDYSILPFEQI